MRWWLALAFALIAAVTAIVVAQVFTQSSKAAFRERAGELAVGASVAAADDIARNAISDGLDGATAEAAKRHGIALFLFDSDDELATSTYSRGLEIRQVPQVEDALSAVAEGRRFIASDEDVKSTVVGLPVLVAPGGLVNEQYSLVAYAPRPGLATELGIVREKIVQAALWAVLVGAVVGLLVALLITARLRRIGAAAASIEAGNFEQPLRPRFRDELGALALTVDRMRQRLRDSFSLLEAERDRLSLLLERLQDGVLTVNKDLQVEFANGAARRFLGQPALANGDPLPEPWSGFSLASFSRGLFSGGLGTQARVAESEEHFYTIAGLPARRPADTALLVITDVSEQERREEAEREFVTNAAHELRTPLAAITSAVDVLQHGAKEIPEERDRFLAHIEREAARLARLTKALLVLARAQTREEVPRLTPVDVGDLLDEIAAGMKPADDVTIEVRCPAGLTALAERDLAEQALANLAANAVQQTEHGRILLSAEAHDGSVVIEVSDTGRGISSSEQERVFDRFYRAGRRDPGGFGLGLAIARQAVLAMGGAVELDSTLGEGTSVRLVLANASRRAA
jgi:signal transduction histidine kinase/HAMP domain-containing protein